MWYIVVKNRKFYPNPISLTVGDEQVFLSTEDAKKMIAELQKAIEILDKQSII